MRKTKARLRIKERITVSLSPNSVDFVRSVSTKEKLHVSTVIDRLIESFRIHRERAKLNASIAARYDSSPQSTIEEQNAWGEVGLEGLAAAFEDEVEPIVPEEAMHAGNR